MEKICRRCGESKSLELFSKDSSRKDGYDFYCKACKSVMTKDSREKSVEKYRRKGSEWYFNNKDKARESNRRATRKYRAKNIDKVRKICRESAKKRKNATAQWRADNREKVRGYGRAAVRKILSTAKGRLNHNIRSYIRKSLQGGKMGRHWESLVGYTLEQLKKHLEKQFLPGMSWDNYGKFGWHIDHKIPVSKFNYEAPEDRDFQRCWALKNLQPLWWDENLKKGNRRRMERYA